MHTLYWTKIETVRITLQFSPFACEKTVNKRIKSIDNRPFLKKSEVFLLEISRLTTGNEKLPFYLARILLILREVGIWHMVSSLPYLFYLFSFTRRSNYVKETI